MALSAEVKDMHTYDLGIPLLDIDSYDTFAHGYQETCLKMFIALFFVIGKTKEKLKLETTQMPFA